ncbi:MAG TPA: lysozyme inhibitor LprI family protein [Cytophaga sp.]|jgi:hypothetical protein|nr:lysozyme inhibitor LprI family protein [Cytophaga sp.]
MKKYFIAFLIAVLVCVLNINGNAQNYVFELPCDTLTTQSEMNRCTALKSKMVDSVVDLKYNCLLQVLQNDFKKSMLEKDTLQADYYKGLIVAVEVSQKNYLALSKANRFFYNNLYEGGSVRSMMVNLSSIADGIDRLKKLDGFFQDFIGDDRKVCK